MKNGGKSSSFLLVLAVFLIFVIGFLALILISQNRNSTENVTPNNENQLKQMYFGDKEILLSKDWEIESFEKSENAELAPYFCNFEDVDSDEVCTVYKLSNQSFDSIDVITVASYPVSFNFAGGSTPFVMVEEDFEFLNGNEVLNTYYDVDTGSEEFDPNDQNTWFADLNSIQVIQVCSSKNSICLASDLRNLEVSKQKDFVEAFRKLALSF